MFIEFGQFPYPVGESCILLFEVQRVLVRLSLMELFVKTRFAEEGFTVSSLVIMGNDIGHNFQSYGSHASLLFRHESITKEWLEFNADNHCECVA